MSTLLNTPKPSENALNTRCCNKAELVYSLEGSLWRCAICEDDRNSLLAKQFESPQEVENSGGPNSKYDLPADAKILQDLIEHKNMNFAVANIFKACYRLGDEQNPDVVRDLEKMVFFAERELARLNKNEI